MLDAQFSILDARFSILDARFSILDSGCSILDARFSILDIRFSMHDIEIPQTTSSRPRRSRAEGSIKIKAGFAGVFYVGQVVPRVVNYSH